VAVASVSRCVGIDIEENVPRSNAFVDHFYTESEKRMLINTLEGISRDSLINALWTRKEAASKVGGWGASLVFGDIDCSRSETIIRNRAISLKTEVRIGMVASIAVSRDTANG
jgi:phosphopantetheinyl transferase